MAQQPTSVAAGVRENVWYLGALEFGGGYIAAAAIAAVAQCQQVRPGVEMQRAVGALEGDVSAVPTRSAERPGTAVAAAPRVHARLVDIVRVHL